MLFALICFNDDLKWLMFMLPKKEHELKMNCALKFELFFPNER